MASAQASSRINKSLSNSGARFLNRCFGLVQAMLPQACLLCGAAARGALVCPACDAELPRLATARCRKCAVPLATGDICGGCLDAPPQFDRVSPVFYYSFPVDALVHALKYHGNLVIARFFGEALGAAVAGEAVDVILPMPLSRERLCSRGFNQAQEIARRVSITTGIPISSHLAQRTVDTPSQAALPWRRRMKNVRGAFVCGADLSGRSVAVVDDVMTTGATLNELARILRRAGATAVFGWVVARALRQDQTRAIGGPKPPLETA